MTEEEKQGLRQLKADVIVYLQGEREELYRRFREALVETDPRIGEYVLGCILHPEAHNLYELLGVKRFFYLLSRYEWRPGRVRHFFRFYEALKFSGLEGRRRYRLTPVQAFIFANIYGFYHDGLRLIRTAYLFVPRKFSKTTSVASMALYDMLFGDHNAQAYIGANSYNQAKICFDEIRAIMSGLDPDGRHIRINREQIFFKDRGRDSLIRCLTANAKTQDGLNASLAILDEYAQARDTSGKSGAALKNVLTSSMGVRKQPLTVVCTTASDVVDGPFARELDGVLQVLREELENDSIYAAIFMPDVDDAESDPATWRKVQPHLGVTVREDYYAKEWADAQLSADKLLEFRTKLLNIFAVNERSAWITSKVVGSATRPFALGAFGRVPAMCALDLSESDDFSAVSFGIYRQQERSFWFYTRYYFPEGALEGHPNERLYRIWAEQGHLTLTPGDVIDYRVIVDDILAANREVELLGIGYDPWKSQEVINMLAAAGAKNVLRPVKQTYGYFTAPVQSFEHGIKTGHVFLNDNPINGFCFGNAILDEDNLENRKPVKRAADRKIDGAITTLMTMRLFIDYER
ncbi:MAG: terminase large subunit [Bacteroidales bacterium]|jgi:phage terminase large subunit-like protein|nr:terminase large subunit [Bacteroidales bacterium]MBR4216765.1 hypothetical protein [Candidatus Methanomethylophilaceae archaeon]